MGRDKNINKLKDIMRKLICEGIAINLKIKKEKRKSHSFQIPETFPLKSVEKLRKNLEILEINGFDIKKHGATTDSICDIIEDTIREGRSTEPPPSRREWSIQTRAEKKAAEERDLEAWERNQLVFDVVARQDEILNGEKTFNQVYGEEVYHYRTNKLKN